jgi:hypothetical protein
MFRRFKTVVYLKKLGMLAVNMRQAGNCKDNEAE